METNAGVVVLEDLLAGIGSPVAYDHTHARIGVGDGNGTIPTTTAADTSLTASTNKLFVGMVTSYPQQSGTSLTYQASFGTSSANFPWNEWAIDNGASSGPAILLNHKGVPLGVKQSGSTWTFTVTVTQHSG